MFQTEMVIQRAKVTSALNLKIVGLTELLSESQKV